jgi:mono/diheme cytochrome c family protein
LGLARTDYIARIESNAVRKTMRRLRLIVVAVGTLLISAALSIVIGNLLDHDRRYPLERIAVTASSDPQAVQRGKRIADITGCTDCHKADLRGGIFVDDGWLTGRYYASNLTLLAQQYSDEDLARIIRTGVRPDGRGVVAMPSFGFIHLTNDEIADVLAFVRSMPAGGERQPPHWIGPYDHWRLFRNIELRPTIAYVAGERNKRAPDAGSAHETGRHLAGIACSECHGGDLTGDGWSSGAPDLAIIRSYDIDTFTRLLRTGVGADGKEHGLMTRVALDRLHKMANDEIAGIYAYLVARASLPR